HFPSLALLDVDGDGAPDVFLDDPMNGPGQGSFGAPTFQIPTQGWWEPLVSPVTDPAYQPYAQAGHLMRSVTASSLYRDLDGDGQPDILLAYKDPSSGNDIHYDAVRFRGSNHRVEVSPASLPTDPCKIWIDANGDGLLDVVTPGNGATYINYGGGFVRSA